MHSALATTKQRSVLTTVNQTVSKNRGVDSTSSTVDSTDLEAEAKSALKLCEEHLAEVGSSTWFLGSECVLTFLLQSSAETLGAVHQQQSMPNCSRN